MLIVVIYLFIIFFFLHAFIQVEPFELFHNKIKIVYKSKNESKTTLKTLFLVYV